MKSHELIRAIEEGKRLSFNGHESGDPQYDMRIEFWRGSDNSIGYHAYGWGSAHCNDVGNMLKIIMEVPHKFKVVEGKWIET